MLDTQSSIKFLHFAGLTQEDCDLLASHINSVPRVSLNNSTPYEITMLLIGEEDLKKSKIKKD